MTNSTNNSTVHDVLFIKKLDGSYDTVSIAERSTESNTATNAVPSPSPSDALPVESPVPAVTVIPKKIISPPEEMRTSAVHEVQKNEDDDLAIDRDSAARHAQIATEAAAHTPDWEREAEEVIQTARVSVPSELHTRLRAVVISRLKGVRDTIAMTEVLQRVVTDGGLGLSADDRQSIIRATETVYKNLHTSLRQVSSHAAILPGIAVDDMYSFDKKVPLATPQQADHGSRPVSYQNILARSLHQSAVSSKTIEPPTPSSSGISLNNSKSAAAKSPTTTATAAVSGSSPAVSQVSASPNPSPTTKDATELTHTSAGVFTLKSAVKKVPTSQQQVSMTDVAAPSRLMDPVDELGRMRLIDFRRLATSVDARLQKIKEKINALDDESFTKKVAGIRAWRSSPLFKQYIQLGHTSLETHQTIAQVMQDAKAQGDEPLTPEEFEKIGEFNRQLRY